MTQLATLFQKPINRPIEGVIKADDAASLRQEVEEYVLTNEVAKRLENFLAAYNNYRDANGVWISGFFGSGKSHLLKMLSLLLSNQTVDGDAVLNLFLPKCGDNEFLRGELKRAVSIPSRSILFNIDQKADVISKNQIDAVLAVFVKVFDEMSGYFGKQGYIAQFERDLDNRGHYTAFKQAYQDITGRDWEQGREQVILEGANIAAAYAQVTGTAAADARGILDKYRSQYKLSIEDFADMVKAYVDKQGSNFRLNFFVDEVGQYVADNTKLMTNLQTIAESLATKSRGQAWLIVTAQEEMDSVIGEMAQQQGNDFTKIQARFKNRMKLTSADVAEVIQKRLLAKNSQGVTLLTAVYKQQHNNFKTFFDFADGAQTYRNYRDESHFVHSYPFIPYQFTLFQSAIQGLSLHNAFEGRHSSVGERSMLGVFQEVAVRIAEHEVGDLATFDLMFEGIRASLKSNIQRAVLNAEQHLDNPFAIKVLKALFLVKYVKEFRATKRNLSVLLFPSFTADLATLRDRLEEALNLLEQQTYIQRNGEEYAYLTDEEKDVEEEIKNTEVEPTAVSSELEKLIFDHILKERKIRYGDKNGHDYPFTRKLDDHFSGREYELTIHVISPFHEHTGNKTILLGQTLGRDELLVILPSSDRLMRDLMLYKQTDKYTRQNTSTTQQESKRRILTDKQFQNQERYTHLRTLVSDLLTEAELIVAGQTLDEGGRDPKSRLVRGFYTLIERTYPNLQMLRGVAYREDHIAQHLKPATTLLGDTPASYSEAEREMLNFVNTNHRNGVRTTLRTLTEKFEHKPYGWYLAAVQCILAKLCARGKIELRQDSYLLEEGALERAIRNTRDASNIILDPQIEFTAVQVRQLRDFHADFFSTPPHANEAKALAQETADSFRNQQQTLTDLRRQATHYPFLTALDKPLDALKSVVRQPYTFYLTELRQQEDQLLDLKEDVIDPILTFMNGSQKEIYDETRQLLQVQEANFSYVGQGKAQQLRQLLDDPHCYQGNKMQQAKALGDELQTAVSTRLQQEREATLARIDNLWRWLTKMTEYGQLTTKQQQMLQQPFLAIKQKIERQQLIDVIHGQLRRFENREYTEQLEQMMNWAQQPPTSPSANAEPTERTVAEPAITYEIVKRDTLAVPFDKALLTTAADVDAYVEKLRQTLLDALNDGKQIQV